MDEPGAYADAAIALSTGVDQIPTVFERLCEEVGLRRALGADVSMSVDEIASTMYAVENQPMLDNNSRSVSDDERRMLAERTIQVWRGLWNGAA